MTTRAIPRVRTWTFRYYRYDDKNSRKPYRLVRINAPTKLLARLQAERCPVGEWRTISHV